MSQDQRILREGRRDEGTQPPTGKERLAGLAAAFLASVLCAAAVGLAAENLFARTQWGTSARAAAAPAAEAPAAAAPAIQRLEASATPGAAAAAAGAPAQPAPAKAEEPPRIETEGEIARGETLARALARRDVDASVAHVIDRAMSPVFDFRYARAGDRFRLVQDEAGEVIAFEFARSRLERYVLRRADGELVAERDEPEILRRRARIAGIVSSSLYEAITELGESPELAGDFADIFAWDVDFARGVRSGDEFAILYERRYLPAGSDSGSEGGGEAEPEYLGPGRILAARYSNADRDFAAIWFEPEDGSGGYYRPDGSSVRRQFLKAPLSYRRISSGFSRGRMHPILKVRRPHLGVDYAARRGTPVWAVADGTVVHVGRSGGLGKTVKVRHRNGYTSYYGHLSGYPRGLRVGQRVQQKQVVGYVGSSGLATGPHLHFTLKQHGRYVNPARIDAPSAEPLPEARLPEFGAVRDARLAELDPNVLRAMTNEAL